jgi:hypothetical protein
MEGRTQRVPSPSRGWQAILDAASICTLTTEVESTYSLDTGDLVSTTTTTTVLYLNSINY